MIVICETASADLPLSRLRHQPTRLASLRMLDKKQCNKKKKIITRLMDFMFVSVKCLIKATNIIAIMWAFLEKTTVYIQHVIN